MTKQSSAEVTGAETSGNSNGTTSGSKKKRYTQQEKDAAIQKVKEGNTVADVAKEMKVSAGSINNWMKKAENDGAGGGRRGQPHGAKSYTASDLLELILKTEIGDADDADAKRAAIDANIQMLRDLEDGLVKQRRKLE